MIYKKMLRKTITPLAMLFVSATAFAEGTIESSSSYTYDYSAKTTASFAYTPAGASTAVTFTAATDDNKTYTYSAEVGTETVVFTATTTDGEVGTAESTFYYTCTVDGETPVEANADGYFEITSGDATYLVSISPEGVPTVVEEYEAEVKSNAIAASTYSSSSNSNATTLTFDGYQSDTIKTKGTSKNSDNGNIMVDITVDGNIQTITFVQNQPDTSEYVYTYTATIDGATIVFTATLEEGTTKTYNYTCEVTGSTDITATANEDGSFTIAGITDYLTYVVYFNENLGIELTEYNTGFIAITDYDTINVDNGSVVKATITDDSGSITSADINVTDGSSLTTDDLSTTGSTITVDSTSSLSLEGTTTLVSSTLTSYSDLSAGTLTLGTSNVADSGSTLTVVDGDLTVDGALKAYYSTISADNVAATSVTMTSSEMEAKSLSTTKVDLTSSSLTADTLNLSDQLVLKGGSIDVGSLVFDITGTYSKKNPLYVYGDTLSTLEIVSLEFNLTNVTTSNDVFYASGNNASTYAGETVYTIEASEADPVTVSATTGLTNALDGYTYYNDSSTNYAVDDATGEVYTYTTMNIFDTYTLADGSSLVTEVIPASSSSIGSVVLNIDGLEITSNDLVITLGALASDSETTVTGDAVANITGYITYSNTLTINAGEVEGSTTLNVFQDFYEATTTGTDAIVAAYKMTESDPVVDGTKTTTTYSTTIEGTLVEVAVIETTGSYTTCTCSVGGTDIDLAPDNTYTFKIGAETYVLSFDGETPTIVETTDTLVFTASVNDFDNVNIDNNVSIEGSTFAYIDNVVISDGASFATTPSAFSTVGSVVMSDVDVDAALSFTTVESVSMSDVDSSASISLTDVDSVVMNDVDSSASISLTDVDSLTLSEFTSSSEDAFKVTSTTAPFETYVYTQTNGDTYEAATNSLTATAAYKYTDASDGAYITTESQITGTTASIINSALSSFTYVDAEGTEVSGLTNAGLTYYDAEGTKIESSNDTTEVYKVVYGEGSEYEYTFYVDADAESVSYLYDTVELTSDTTDISYTTYTTININGNVDFSGTLENSESYTAFYVDDNTMLSGNISATYTYEGTTAEYEAESYTITLNAIEADDNGVINLADGTTVSATIVDGDDNFIAYGNALTNDSLGTSGLTLNIDGTVTIYGNITANSPLTINGVEDDYTGTLVVAGGVISASDSGTDIALDNLNLVLTTDEEGTMASFADSVDTLSVTDSSISVEASSTTVAGDYENFVSEALIAYLETYGITIELPDGMTLDSNGTLVVETVSYFSNKATSGSAASLGDVVDSMSTANTGLSTTKIVAFKTEIEANGLDSYVMSSNSYMAEVNTMLLSNQNFANVNRARTILAKNTDSYLDSKPTGATSSEVDQIKNSSLAQVQSINLLGSKDGDSNAAGYDYWSVGATANMDCFLSDNCLAGISLGGVYSKVEGDAGDNANSTAFLLNAYAVYALDNLDIFANIGYAHFWNEGSKAGAGSSDWDSDAFNLALGVSYAIETGVEGLKLSPIAMFDLVFIENDDASYSNGVDVCGESYTSAKFMIGIEVDYAFTSQFAASIKALYSCEMADTSYDNSYSVTAAGYTLSGINYYGSDAGASAAIIGAGLSYDFSESCSAYFDYTAYIYEALTTHSLNLSVALKF